jgi:hypothetical protein
MPAQYELTLLKTSKVCTKCGQELPLEAFGADRFQRSGQKPRCKPCRRLETQKQYRTRISTPGFKQANREHRIDWRNSSAEAFLRTLCQSARQRAKRIEAPFTIDEDVFIGLWGRQKGRCYYSGVEMTCVAGRGKLDTNVSIERLIPSIGYVQGNVVLCCYYINVSKRDKSVEEWLAWARRVSLYQQERADAQAV